MVNKRLDYYQERFFDGVIIIIYILIIISFLGIFTNASTYLNDVNYYLRVYVCLFLIWRFNPFRSIDMFTNLDRKIAFNAGIFILTTTILNTYIVEIKQKFNNNKVVSNIRGDIDYLIASNSF
jgi:hypothetical protein